MQCNDGQIGKPGKGQRFFGACVGARRSTVPVSLRPVVHLCLACLRGSHCLCPPVSVMHFVTLATRNLRTHRSSSRWSIISLLRTVLQTGQVVSCTVLESSKQQKQFLFAQITLLVVEQQNGQTLTSCPQLADEP